MKKGVIGMKPSSTSASMKSASKRAVCRAFLLLSAALLIFIAFDPRLAVRRYVVDAAEITSEIRIVLVTDLHSCHYGDNQRELIDAVNRLNPDLVLLGGDIFDDILPDGNTELFLADIAGRYPCCYVTGNHEYWSGPVPFARKMSILEQYGIFNLSGGCKTISVKNQTIRLCGADDPEAYARSDDPANAFTGQLRQLAAGSADDQYTVLLSHRPEYFETYAECGFDLALCGHAHGGQWRIPLILNGLFAPDQGLFPEYAGGRYTLADTTMIVSRGLARESTRIPRIFNRPELVLIELQ